jgi:hypothetical protein
MARRPHWSLDDIPYGAIDRGAIAGDECFFHLIAAASFIEITSDAYTKNLVEYCAGEPEVVDWLEHGWQGEEMQHGLALRRYVETVWPEFDWERAYQSFMTEYARLCSVEFYAPTRALEMAGRCVVETGTSSFYRMLADAAPEPVLRQLTALISNDEIDHYKHFYRYFRLFAEKERPSRWAVARTLLARIAEIDNEDGAIAFKHVRLQARPDAPHGDAEYDAFRQLVRSWGMNYYRFDRAVRMVLKPMALPGSVSRLAEQVGVGIARRRLFA